MAMSKESGFDTETRATTGGPTTTAITMMALMILRVSFIPPKMDQWLSTLS